MADPFSQIEEFSGSMGGVMGSWMLDLTKADLARQQGWLQAVQALMTPGKDGKIPMLEFVSGITGPDGKPIAGAEMSFPVALGLMGSQFGAQTAKFTANMNVDSSTLDDVSGQQSGSGSGEASFGWGALKVDVKIQAQFSESEQHKRSTDSRATVGVELEMGRTAAPEPVMRVLATYLHLVDLEGKIAKAEMEEAAKAAAQAAKLLPPDPKPAGG